MIPIDSMKFISRYSLRKICCSTAGTAAEFCMIYSIHLYFTEVQIPTSFILDCEQKQLSNFVRRRNKFVRPLPEVVITQCQVLNKFMANTTYTYWMVYCHVGLVCFCCMKSNSLKPVWRSILQIFFYKLFLKNSFFYSAIKVFFPKLKLRLEKHSGFCSQ